MVVAKAVAADGKAQSSAGDSDIVGGAVGHNMRVARTQQAECRQVGMVNELRCCTMDVGCSQRGSRNFQEVGPRRCWRHPSRPGRVNVILRTHDRAKAGPRNACAGSNRRLRRLTVLAMQISAAECVDQESPTVERSCHGRPPALTVCSCFASSCSMQSTRGAPPIVANMIEARRRPLHFLH